MASRSQSQPVKSTIQPKKVTIASPASRATQAAPVTKSVTKIVATSAQTKQAEEERVRKIHEELVKFMIEESVTDQQKAEQFGQTKAKKVADTGTEIDEELAAAALSLPKTVHERTTERERMKKEQSVKQAKEAKDFFRAGETAENRFTILAKMKDGGFGQVYKVRDKNIQQELALKVEKITQATTKTAPNENSEGIVMKAFQTHPNCPKLFAMGTTAKYTFIAMQLLGENLSEIRRSCALLPKRLSTSSAYRCTLQCLQTIEGLHKIGYIHRDIKPSNFAVGTEPKQRHVVFLLDFGLCRRFTLPDGTIAKPRDNVGFRGTVRYASVNAHDKKELGRVDDLWSLYYLFIELITGQLPWRKTNDKEAVGQMKRRYTPEVLSQMFPPEVGNYCRALQKLTFFEAPDYELLRKSFAANLQKIKASMDDSYDWQLEDCAALPHWELPK